MIIETMVRLGHAIPIVVHSVSWKVAIIEFCS